MVELDRNLEGQSSSAAVSNQDISSTDLVFLLEELKSVGYVVDVVRMLSIARRIIGRTWLRWMVRIWGKTVVD